MNSVVVFFGIFQASRTIFGDVFLFVYFPKHKICFGYIVAVTCIGALVCLRGRTMETVGADEKKVKEPIDNAVNSSLSSFGLRPIDFL